MTSQRTHSISLVVILLISSLALLIPADQVSGATAVGTITSDETWTGSHSITGDIVIAPGVKVVIQPGTNIELDNGSMITVRGNLCAGDIQCGASGMASNASRIQFTWSNPGDASAIGDCANDPNQNPYLDDDYYNRDPSCGEGILLKDSIDVGQTRFNHVSIINAYGIPDKVASVNNDFRSAALILDGASPTLEAMKFQGVNTSSVLVHNLATPTFVGGEFVNGDDEGEIAGNGVQIYGAGTTFTPTTMSSPVFTGGSKGCGQQDGGRHVLWAQESFISIQNAVVGSGDFGFRSESSSGTISSATIAVTCNAIDVNGAKVVGSQKRTLTVTTSDLNPEEGAGFTVADGAKVVLSNSKIEGSSGGSGVFVKSSEAHIHDNVIGPIGGWNGIWQFGSFDTIIERNTIQNTAREAIIVGDYHEGESGFGGIFSAPSRSHISNNTIVHAPTADCSSDRVWDDLLTRDFFCPAVHVYRSAATLKDNTITVNGTDEIDAIRVIGSLANVQRNTISAPGTGARIVHFNDGSSQSMERGSIAFFSENQWSGVMQAYNVTKSALTIQSENLPPVQTGTNATTPVGIFWPEGMEGDGKIYPPPMITSSQKNMTPTDFPLAVDMLNNSTVLTMANVSIDVEDVYIGQLPVKWAAQVRVAELVRFYTSVNNIRVSDATVVVKDAVGNDLYDLETGTDGWTEWISLPKDFHLDYRGLGPSQNDPDNFATAASENSCNDGIDNDGDAVRDQDDPDCASGSNTRELSLYRYTAYRFGKGYQTGSFTIQDSSNTIQEAVALDNLAPSLNVTQNDYYSFKRVVNFTGTAHDGNFIGIYGDNTLSVAQRDALAKWDQKGVVTRIQVKDPFTNDWADASYATDTSGVDDVSYNDHPFSSWYFTYDMSTQAEGDYTFSFRAFDGVDYGNIVTRTIKLNTQPPSLILTTPGDSTEHNGKEGVVFSGTASDPYSGTSGVDIQNIHIVIDRLPGDASSTRETIRSVAAPGGESWTWEWNTSGLPKTRESYEVTVWASDSDFCIGEIGECTASTRTIVVDNRNKLPTNFIFSPSSGQQVTASETTVISGQATDPDGEITRIEIEVLDPQANFGVLDTLIVTKDKITGAGAWQIEWDSTQLVHLQQYYIQARSYDGYNYSSWFEVVITADNPPDADNTAPTYSSVNWPAEILLFCDTDTQALDRCTVGTLDLNQYFDDPDGQTLSFSAYNNPNILTDDLYDLVIRMPSGVATFDPIEMYFYDTDMATWTLDNVIFIATDPSGSIATSNPVDFTVIAATFTAVTDFTGILEDGEAINFTGMGRPSQSVNAKIAGVPVGQTAVGDDGTWSMTIESSRFSPGTNVVEFTYGGSSDIVIQKTVERAGGEDEGMSLGATLLLGVGTLAILALLGGVFVFFFVEFEDEDEDDLLDDGSTPEVEDDPYAWAKERKDAEAAASSVQQNTVQQVAQPQPQAAVQQPGGYPGWRWDQATQQWVPDPSSVQDQ